MTTPTRTDPPYVPLRAGRWPSRRAPRWTLLAGAGLLAVAVAIGLAHHPTQAQRASDLRGFLQATNADIESCAGGVGESFTVLTAIQSGTSHDVRTAVSLAQTAAANCSPANNELLDDLENYQVPESLASYRLPGAVTGLIDWAAPDAGNVCQDVANILQAHSAAARAAATAALHRDRAALDAKRATVDKVINAAIASLHPGAAAPRLPG